VPPIECIELAVDPRLASYLELEPGLDIVSTYFVPKLTHRL
jgi:hypothetical protein